MRIANYLRPDCVALRQRADSLTGAVQQMVTLLNGTDNLTDTAVFAADVRARLALGGVCVGNGLAIPHAKSTAVKQLQLAALTLDPPLPCDTPDGKPLDLLVMIAAPAEANDLHVQVLAELATLFLDTDFCARLRESETPEAFCRAISAREEQDAQEPPSAPSDAAPGAAKPGYQLLAVTACPTGIAHTYLAAEALQQAAQARGLTLKVETNGAAGVNDELTEDEIQAAECVIVAVDRSIPLARFVGKRLVYASAGDAVRDADRLLEKAVSGKAPVYRGGHAFRTSDWKELGREYYGHLMSGISHMLPFVVAGGVMLALSLLLQHLFGRSDITTMMTNVGNAAFRMMYPVLAAFIAYSIADRPGFMPGLMGGYLAQLGTTTAPRLGWISSGFWGAIVAGFAAGLAVRLLNYLFRRIPQELDHIKTGLLVPLLSLLFVGALMVMAINPPLGRFNAWLSIQLDGMQGGSRLVLGTLLGGMMATDYGGPINRLVTAMGFDRVFWLEGAALRVPIVLLYIWKNLGFSVVIFTAALQAVPESLYEYASLEGAGWFRREWSITLPQILPTAFLVFVLAVVNAFKIFKEVYFIGGAYPAESIYTLQHYMNNKFAKLDYQDVTTAAYSFAVIVIALFLLLYRTKSVRQGETA